MHAWVHPATFFVKPIYKGHLYIFRGALKENGGVLSADEQCSSIQPHGTLTRSLSSAARNTTNPERSDPKLFSIHYSLFVNFVFPKFLVIFDKI